MLRILPCYAVRWKKRIKRTRPRQRKAVWQLIKAPLGRTSLLVCAVILLFGASAAPAAENDGPPTPAERGRVLFVRQWSEHDELTPNGDGLGPMYNARSCVACHNQGGVGGSGSLDRNVDLLSISLPQSFRAVRTKGQFNPTQFADRIAEIHAGFINSSGGVRPNITLHRFGSSRAYGPWRAALLAVADVPVGAGSERIEFKVTQRRTPSLFGAGLIDSIPEGALHELSRLQFARTGPIKGQVASGGGKFGWRGQTAELRSFVRGACANELGLRVSTNDQAVDPLDPAHVSPNPDLTVEQCDDLAAFLASLPSPKQRKPWNTEERNLWEAGSRLFTKTGCANCHTPRVARVEGIYSDLLLHDMGEELSDPVSTTSRGSAEYYGGSDNVFVTVPPLAKRQWRTPPLWAAGISGPYLHDGRAPTLDGAILNHGGEAEMARKNYAALNAESRAKILAFLESLGGSPSENDLASR